MTVVVQRSGGVVTVTLDRPAKKNAVDAPMWAALEAVLSDVAANPDDRVLVLTGAGGDFCSGADLSDQAMAPSPDRPFVWRMRRIGVVIGMLHRLPQPTIAKVDGVAVGVGMNMALGCDLVIASDRARFSEIFTRRGLALDGGGSWVLPRIVGLQKAKELAFFADIIGAAEAAALGLVTRVVPAGSLDEEAGEWARRLAAGPTLALSLTKSMLNHSFAASLEEALEDEARSQHIAMSTADAAEAMRAFADRSEPRFKGH